MHYLFKLRRITTNKKIKQISYGPWEASASAAGGTIISYEISLNASSLSSLQLISGVPSPSFSFLKGFRALFLVYIIPSRKICQHLSSQISLKRRVCKQHVHTRENQHRHEEALSIFSEIVLCNKIAVGYRQKRTWGKNLDLECFGIDHWYFAAPDPAPALQHSPLPNLKWRSIAIHNSV